jgi:hypothetical protein
MIISQIFGGLGNQLFQYSFGRSMSILHNTDLLIDISKYEGNIPDPMRGIRQCSLEYFNIKAKTIKNKTELAGYIKLKKYNNTNLKFINKLLYLYRRIAPFYNINYITENARYYHRFNPKLLKIKNDNLYLCGYWQTEKYFINIEKTIREELSFKYKPDKINKNFINKINNTESVCLHVRHTDNANTKAALHGFLSFDYYQEAIKQLTKKIKNPEFFVFSDNPDWAQKNIRLDYPTCYILHNGEEKNHEDLRLMTYCKHHIIGNSTFSWWGAWLGKKAGQMIFAPRQYHTLIDTKNSDFYPRYWSVINNSKVHRVA